MKTALMTGSALTLKAQWPITGSGIELPEALAGIFWGPTLPVWPT